MTGPSRSPAQLGRLVGLVINPIAGLGGPLGMKGSDDLPGLITGSIGLARSGVRARQALGQLIELLPGLEFWTVSGAMGEEVVRACGRVPKLVPHVPSTTTTSSDSRLAARQLISAGVDVLLFAGGDGTAVDILSASPPADLPVIGIPTGVKMHSAVFARSPQAAAGEVAEFFSDARRGCVMTEVMDLDEGLLRRGIVAPRLAGYLPAPRGSGFRQGPKIRVSADPTAVRGIADQLRDYLAAGRELVAGPGRTIKDALACLGLGGSLLGVDLIRDGDVAIVDASEQQLLQQVGVNALILLSPIGGQGFILGRGNQQIGGSLLKRLSFDAIRVAATPAKLASLAAQPLRVDVEGDFPPHFFPRHVTVLTGSRSTAVYRLERA